MSLKKSINSFFSRLWINKSAIFKLACTYTGVVFTFWGFVSLFNPLDTPVRDKKKIKRAPVVPFFQYVLAEPPACCQRNNMP